MFAVLDMILFGRFMGDICFSCSNAAYLGLIRTIFFLSLPLSAFALATAMRWGFILSYAQFPFRLVFGLLSFGFIIPCLAGTGLSQQLTFTAAVLLEVARLAVTMKIHHGPENTSRNCDSRMEY